MNENLNLYKEILDNMYEGIYFVDTNRKITYWNKAAERISGFSSKEILNSFCYNGILNHVDDSGKPTCKSGCPLMKTIKDGKNRETALYLHHKDGQRVSVAIKTIPLVSEGKIIGAAEVFTDNKEEAERIKEINQLKTYALYDQLTELPNRRYIDSFLDNRIKEFKQLKIPFGVIMMDIDFFKKFNDTYGHNIGDMVLKAIAKTLKGTFRKSDLVGRWGGEEFFAILSSISQKELEIIAEKVRVLVGKTAIRHSETNNKISATISLGATLIKKGDTIDAIIKRADSAMYKSKETGRNKVTVML